MNAQYFFYMRGLDEIRALGGNNNGFRASYIVRNFEFEEEYERTCGDLANAEIGSEEEAAIVKRLTMMGRMMIFDIVEGLTTRDHDRPAKVSVGVNPDGSKKPPVYFRSSIYEAKPYRKVIRQHLFAVAHRFGRAFPDPGEHRTWRLCDADGVLVEPVVTFAEWDEPRQAAWEAAQKARHEANDADGVVPTETPAV